MSKRATLRFEGRLEQGFQVTLEVGDDHNPAFTESSGVLPASIALIQNLERWQQSYRQSLGITRIALENITVKTGTLSQLETCRQCSKDLQSCFREWLDATTFQSVNQRLRETLDPQETIQVLIRSRDQRLHHLPWHIWDFVERYPHAECMLGSPPERIEHLSAANSKVRILAILGDRRGIDTEADRRLLEALPDAEILFLVEPSRQQIHAQLWEQNWNILFFAGHSQTQETQGRIYLNPSESLTVEELKYGLRRAIAQGLQLAIFNSCDGLGLAYELEQLHLPQLIVMREPVPDRVAQEFLKRFLIHFSANESLHSSVRQAREWLQGLEDQFPCASWLPILFQNPAMTSLTWQALCPVASIPEMIAPTRRKLKFRAVLAFSLVITILVTGVRFLGWLEFAELRSYDSIMQLQTDGLPDSRLLIVAVNDRDLKKFGDPLSDRTLSQALKKIEQYQPRVVGLDIFRDQPTREGWNELVTQLQRNQTIVAICNVGEVDGVIDPELAINPPPGLPANRLGFADGLLPDPDDVIRRYVLKMDERRDSLCQSSHSFSWQIVQHYLKPSVQYSYQRDRGIIISNPEQSSSAIIPLLSANFGGYQRTVNDMAGFQLMIRYRRIDRMAQKISLTNLLEGSDADLQQLIHSDRLVLLGYESGDEDRHETPIGNTYGINIHAQVISQLLGMISNQQPAISTSYPQGVASLPEWGKTLWTALWAVLGGWLIWRFRTPWIAWLIALFTLIGCVIVSFILAIWIPIVPPAIAFSLTSLIIGLIKINFLNIRYPTRH
ncbi:CHASE2 domain-containing protein [Phormidesmis priestleyi]